MSALQWAAIGFALLAALWLGMALGCMVNHDRGNMGVLAIGLASFCACGMIVFWFL